MDRFGNTDLYTVCTRSLDLFYMQTYYIIWVKTSWTYSKNEYDGQIDLPPVAAKWISTIVVIGLRVPEIKPRVHRCRLNKSLIV